MSTEISQVKNDVVSYMEKKGVTTEVMSEKLIELLDWVEYKCDKNGNMYEVRDGNLRLKAIELWMKLQNPQAKNNHLHIDSKMLDHLLKK